ncbi:MAG TPA: NrsF family protein [Polyangia bacterium]|nr:NrsF family protein [Polyangia bacterium]
MTMASQDLKARIMEAARKQPAPSRREVAGRVTLTLVTAIVVPILGFIALGAIRPGPRPWSLIIATASGAFGIALAAVWTAFGRGGQMVGRARTRLLAMTIAAPLTFVVWKLVLSGQYAHMTDAWPDRPGFRCFAFTFLLAAWPFLALSSIRRASDPTHPRALGAALGVATGTCAAVLVDLWCPVAHPGHLFLGHVLPIAILGILGVWVGDRILSIRAKK